MSRSNLLVVAIPLCFLAGCASSPLPPRLTSTEIGRMSELPLTYSVGVIPYKHPVYSDKLRRALKAAGIFSKVSPISDFGVAPDLVAEVEESVHGTAIIPAVTIATAGVIPTSVGENHGFIFSLAPFSRRSEKVIVDASYRGATTLGWAAVAVNASPNYTSSDPEQSERFRRMLAYRTLVALHPAKVAER